MAILVTGNNTVRFMVLNLITFDVMNIWVTVRCQWV